MKICFQKSSLSLSLPGTNSWYRYWILYNIICRSYILSLRSVDEIINIIYYVDINVYCGSILCIYVALYCSVCLPWLHTKLYGSILYNWRCVGNRVIFFLLFLRSAISSVLFYTVQRILPRKPTLYTVAKKPYCPSPKK